MTSAPGTAAPTGAVTGMGFASKFAILWRSTETKYAITCTIGRLIPKMNA